MARKLYESELRTVVDWLMYHITQEQRRQLMGDLPRHYQMLTGASDEAILSRVQERLTEARNWPDPLTGRSSPETHTHFRSHDGYVVHSHEVRTDHEGVARDCTKRHYAHGKPHTMDCKPLPKP